MEPSNDLTAPAVPATLGPGQALLVLLTFLAAQFFGGVVVALVGGVWLGLKQGAAAIESVTEIQRALIMPSVLAGAVCGGVFSFLLTWLMLRTTEPPRLRSIGWSRASRRDLLIASLAGLGLAAGYVFGVVPHFPAAPGHRWGPIVQAASSGGWSRHLWAVLGVLIAPPSEELVFRGVLFTGFLRRWSAITAGALVTLLFLLGHLTEVWGYAPALVAVIVLGVATLFARILTKSLAPAVALHAAYNLLLVFTSYAA